MNFQNLPVLILALPLFSAICGGLLGSKLKWLPRVLSVGSAFLVALLAVFLANGTRGDIAISWPWIHLGSLAVNFGFLYTPLSAMMTLVVGVVALAVNIFSVRYMRDDSAQPRYYAGLSLFTFSMLGLTFADNIFMLFAFWELVGFGSYLLIGHLSTPEAGRAANKAFIVNRLADVFFLLGLATLFVATGSFDLAELSHRFVLLAPSMKLTIAGLIFCGVVAKSAQLPLHLWLPDAMQGPTPVSALIHAATMVAAGVFLLCRASFIFVPILPFIAILGTLTALVAAFTAFAQTDLKRVLAYSTISQLGYMVAGFGLGSPAAAFFHLTTHAFFKALLFLCAGAIIDACHHEQEMSRMGGLWRRLPFTFAMFVIGSLALAGFPATAGFFSKDSILALAQEHSPAIFYALMLGSLLTALYMGRLIGLVFLGSPRSENASHAHEGNLIYHAPLVLLALGAIAAGSVAVYPVFARGIFAGLPHPHHPEVFMAWGIFAALCGAVSAWVCRRATADDKAQSIPPNPVFSLLYSGFYFDALWNRLGTFFADNVANAFLFLDEVVLGGVLTKGVSAGFGVVGLFAKLTYRKLLTNAFYWILFGAMLLIFLSNR